MDLSKLKLSNISLASKRKRSSPKRSLKQIPSAEEMERAEEEKQSEKSLLYSRWIGLGILVKAYIIVWKDRLSQEEVDAIKSTPLWKQTEHVTSVRDGREEETYNHLFNNAVYILEHSDSIHEALTDYSRELMRGFSKKERQSKGKVYTGDKSIIKWIHDKLCEYSPISLRKTYWEPACGTGSFVLDWYDRLMKHWEGSKSEYSEIADKHEAHRWIIEKCIYYSDIDPFAIRLCTLALYLKNPSVVGLKWNCFVGDSLLDDPFKEVAKFDYVAGNPPYIGFFKGPLEKPYKKQLEARYSFFKAKGDLLNLFFELALSRGLLSGFVTSRYWMETPCLRIMRKKLKQHIISIWDHGNEKSQFDKTMVLTACYVFSSKLQNTDVEVLNASLLKRDALKEEGWFLTEDPICLKLEKLKRLTDYVLPIDGVNTGANGVFAVTESFAKERAFLIKRLIGGRSVRAYRIDWLQRCLVVCSKEAYETQSTAEARYLKEKEEVLKQRVGNKNPWDFQSNNFSQWEKRVGILSRLYMDHKHYGFALNDSCIGLNANVHLLTCPDLIQAKRILGVLNSKVMHYFFSKKVKRRANNYMVTTPVYKTLPMPSELDPRLDPLVDKMLTDSNDKQTEAEINKIVYELYNLTEDEIKLVEETVG